MPKLTAPQIQFIYNYLENSGIEYLDARVEMADHIASALEEMNGDFYDNFKVYMLENKESLLAQYGSFKKAALRKGLTILKNNVLSIWFMIAVIIVYIFKYPASCYFDGQTLIDIYKIASLVPGFILGIYLSYLRIINKWTFSILDQVFGSFVLLHIIDPRYFLEGLESIAIYHSFTAVFTLASLVSFLKIYRRYNNLYVQNLTMS